MILHPNIEINVPSSSIFVIFLHVIILYKTTSIAVRLENKLACDMMVYPAPQAKNDYMPINPKDAKYKLAFT